MSIMDTFLMAKKIIAHTGKDALLMWEKKLTNLIQHLILKT